MALKSRKSSVIS